MNGLSLRPLSTGEVLDQAFQMYRGHFPKLALVALVCYVPVGVLLAILTRGIGGAVGPASFGMSLGTTVIILASFLDVGVCWTALAKVCDGAVAGADVQPGEAVAAGLRLLPRVVLLGVLSGLLMIPAMVPAVVLGAIPARILGRLGLGAGGGAISAIVVTVGVVAGMVLGFVWWVPMGMLSLPAIVGEGLGASAALSRANKLSAGARIRTSALGVIAWLIMALPTMAIYFLLGAGIAFTGQAISVGGATALVQILGWGIGALTAPFFVAVIVTAYYERRVRREGYDVEVASEALSAGAGGA